MKMLRDVNRSQVNVTTLHFVKEKGEENTHESAPLYLKDSAILVSSLRVEND
jgi:hypothetical protein